MKDLVALTGFTVEPWGLTKRFVLVKSPTGLMATLDLEQRGFRSGGCVTGRMISTEIYSGRFWKQRLCNDAAAWLGDIERNRKQP